MMEEWRNGEGGGPAQVFSWMVGHMTKIKKMETPKIKNKVDKPIAKYPLQYQQSKRLRHMSKTNKYTLHN